MLQVDTSRGSIYYSEDLIKNIVALSTMECYGVVGMASHSVQQGIWELLRNNINKGVKVDIKDNKLNVKVYVIIKYGIKVSVTANTVIQNIKQNIEEFIGFSVNSITVNVQGIGF